MYINVGAYVDEGTMIDSHALVGSCAQIGKRVHLSAGAQIGGVLEPVGALPVIIEDDVTGGRQLRGLRGDDRPRAARCSRPAPSSRRDASSSTWCATGYRREGDAPLEIPAGAVVVPGTRPVRSGAGPARRVSALRPGHRQVPGRKDRPLGADRRSCCARAVLRPRPVGPYDSAASPTRAGAHVSLTDRRRPACCVPAAAPRFTPRCPAAGGLRT